MLVQSVLTVIAALVFTLPIQRGGNTRDPIRTNSCSAPGASCLFGEAPGCSVTCPEPLIAHCKYAYCCYGFPHSAVCKCLNG